MGLLAQIGSQSRPVHFRDGRVVVGWRMRYPHDLIAADIRACDSEGALIRAAWRWWSTEV